MSSPPGPGTEEKWVTRPITEEVSDVIVDLSLAFAFIGGGVWGIMASWATDVTFWWPTLLGLAGVLFGLFIAIMQVAKWLTKSVELAGFLSKKREDRGLGDDPTRYYIRVSGTEYEVHRKLYNGISEGTAVSLKLRGGYAMGRTVMAIRLGMSPTVAAQRQNERRRNRENDVQIAAFRKLEELLGQRDQRAEVDKVRAVLVELGVEAHPSKKDPFGTIDIAAGPIVDRQR